MNITTQKTVVKWKNFKLVAVVIVGGMDRAQTLQLGLSCNVFVTILPNFSEMYNLL